MLPKESVVLNSNLIWGFIQGDEEWIDLEKKFNNVLQDIAEISRETVRAQLEDWY